MTFTKLKTWFADYSSRFRSDDELYTEHINQKISHTYRVVKFAEEIAAGENLDSKDFFLAQVIALLHDSGRFEQYDKYSTFHDAESEDHALLAIKLINETCILDELDNVEKEIIIEAIKNHNKPHIDLALSGRPLYFAKLIRDADKLDIINLVDDYLTGGKRIKHGLTRIVRIEDNSDGISEDVMQKFVNGEIISYRSLKTLNDRKLLLLGWSEDFNYSATHKIVLEQGYFTTILNSLPGLNYIQDRYNQIETAMKKKAKAA